MEGFISVQSKIKDHHCWQNQAKLTAPPGQCLESQESHSRGRFTRSHQVKSKAGDSIERERISQIKVLKVMIWMTKERMIKSLWDWWGHWCTSQKCGSREDTFRLAEIIIFYLQDGLQFHGRGLCFSCLWAPTPYPLCHAGHIMTVKKIFFE